MMEAGRELDALVAEKVMGWRPVGTRTRYDSCLSFMPVSQLIQRAMDLKTIPTFEEGPWGEDEENPPEFSTDIAAAWQVVEHMRKGHWFVSIESRDAANWEVSFEKDGYDSEGNPRQFHFDIGAAPLAICRAALAAVSRSATSSVAALPADQD